MMVDKAELSSPSSASSTADFPQNAPQGPSRTRVAPSFLLLILAPLAAMTVVSLVQGGIYFGETRGEIDYAEWFEQQEWTLARFFSAILPVHATLLAVTLIATKLSRRPFRERLGLVRPPLPHLGPLGGAFLFGHAAAAAAIAFAFIAGLTYSKLFGTPSAEFIELNEMLGRQTGLSGFAALSAVALIPAFSEELLYRGFAQTRLTERFGPLAAILICGSLFALTHQEPMQIFVVFPVGLVFGFVRWRTASIWPAMVAHALYNSSVMLLMRMEAQAGGEVPLSSVVLFLFILIGGLFLCPLALHLLRRTTPPGLLRGEGIGLNTAVGQDLGGRALENRTAAKDGQRSEQEE